MSRSQEDPKAFVGFAPWTLISQEPSLLSSPFLAVPLRAASARHAASEQVMPFCTAQPLALLCRTPFRLKATGTAYAAARRAGEEVWRPCYTGHISVLGMLHLGTAGREGATKGQGEGREPPKVTLKGHRG